MIKSFVDKGKYITLSELMSLNVFCQLLPGATASQTVSLLGYRQGGIRLAILTLLIWMFPAVVMMAALSFLLTSHSQVLTHQFRFIQPMALAFLAFASFKSYALIDQRVKWGIVIISSFSTFLLFSTPWVFPIVLFIGGILGFFLFRSEKPIHSIFSKKLRFTPLVLFAILFLLAGYLSETARKDSWEYRRPFNLFENMYRFGAIVFGGADVLIPVMYNQYVVRPESATIKRNNNDVIAVQQNDFLSAAGVVRALPGPAYSISAFIGGIAMNDRGWSYQLLGCFIAVVAIFTPSFLLSIFFFPFWESIQHYRGAGAIMLGINAAVVGIMTASIFYLFRDTAIPFLVKPLSDIILFCIVFISTVFLLYRSKISPPIIAVGCFLLGFL